jgi:predicted deacylase
MSFQQKLGAVKRNLLGRLKNHWVPLSFPSKLQKITLTKTVHHAHVDLYRLGSGSQKVLFLSAIHGNEVGTVKLNCSLMSHLSRHKKDFKDFSFYFIPCFNPDGYIEAQRQPDYKNGGRVGRLNAHQVDLNRNFPTKDFKMYSVWSHGKNYSEKTKVYCGRTGASERETKALVHFLKEERIPFIFSFHNVGGDVTPSQNPFALELAADYAQKTSFKKVSHEEWKKLEQTGTLKKWCEENQVALLEVEGSPKASRWGSDWSTQKKALLSALAKIRASGYNAAT